MRIDVPDDTKMRIGDQPTHIFGYALALRQN